MDLFEQYAADLRSLVLFRGICADPCVSAMLRVLEAFKLPVHKRVDRYAEFTGTLLKYNESWTAYLLDCVINDDNPVIRAAARGEQPGALLRECAEQELAKLERLSRLRSQDFFPLLGYNGYLPAWQTSSLDFSAAFSLALREAPGRGYGIFAQHHMFTYKNGALCPVLCPDPIRLDLLYGYEPQRAEVVSNTLALLGGYPAANTLLYGDAGTGKSSTVKAVANEYAAHGLRLIELSKRQLHEIPDIIALLADNPLKFILFVDDLSFTSAGDEFNALKAVLEGSAASRAANFAIYATSNRRHMIKERFSDRDGDEIHVNESIQELCSLSDRFGLSVGFFKPDQQQYLEIVRALRRQYHVALPEDTLLLEAERFATQRGGRSPRTALQFIQQRLGGEASTALNDKTQ